MSDNVTFKELLDLPEKFFKGQSKISLEATVIRTVKTKEGKLVREVKGSKDGRDYHFFSQFVVANDGTADMGLDLSLGKAEDSCKEGMVIKLQNGKADIYKDRKGNTQRKLKGKLEGITRERSQPKDDNGYETLSDGRTVVSREVWEKKDNRITRLSLAMKYIETGKSFDGKPIKKAKKDADNWVNWIYQLEGEPKGEPKPEKKPEEKSTKKEEFDEIMDEKFDRDRIKTEIAQLWGRAFKAKQVKGDISKWISENFEGKHSLLTFDDSEMIEARNKLKAIVEDTR